MANSDSTFHIAFQAELSQAESARVRGKEGMARVCARRAAGFVVRAYFEKNNIPYSGHSAYEHIKQLNRIQGIKQEVFEVTEHLLMRITPEHTLAVDADLILETRWLARELLGESW